MKKTGTPAAASKKSVRRRHAPIARIALHLSLATLTAPMMVQAKEVTTPTKEGIVKADSRNYNIPKQPLYSALSAFAEQARIQFVYNAEIVKNLTSPGVQGQHTADAALQQVLSETGITFRHTGPTTVTLEKAPQSKAGATTLKAMTVIGKADDEKTYLPPNISTISKTDIPIFDTPASIQIVSKALIQDQQGTRLEEALQNVSGVSKAFSFYGGDSPLSTFNLRGFATQDKYVNGVRMSDNAYDMSRVERVEVLKGASGMLFGQMDPGGVINLVTKKPKETTQYSVQQQFGSYDFYRNTASATGPLSKKHNLFYSMDFTYQDAGSFRNNVSDNRYIITPMLSWRPLDETEVNLTYQHRYLDTVYDSGIPAVHGAIANVPISTTYQQPGFRDKMYGDFVDFNWSHKLTPDWKITNGVAANWNKYQQNEVPIAYAQPKLDSNNLVRRGLYIENINNNSQTVYLNLTGQFNTGLLKHNILVGTDFFSKAVKQSGYFVLGIPLPERLNVFTYVDVNQPIFPSMDVNHFTSLAKNSPNDFSNTRQDWLGVYFQDQMTLWDKLHIMGGGRYDWARAETNSATGTSFLNPATNSGANSQHFSPRTGLVYEPVSWLSLFGNYVESFHLQNAGLRSASGTPLSPETSNQYETGFKTRFLDDRLQTNVAFYNIDKQNVATLVGNNVYSTIGKARSQGAEIDVTGQLTNTLSLNASYAYTDAKIISGIDAGNRLPNVARNSGSLWLKYAFQLSALRGFSLGGGVFPTGQRWADTSNTLSLTGYLREDIFASYTMKVKSSVITAQLNVRNLLNKTYYDNTTVGSSIYMNHPGEPRVFMGSIKLEF